MLLGNKSKRNAIVARQLHLSTFFKINLEYAGVVIRI